MLFLKQIQLCFAWLLASELTLSFILSNLSDSSTKPHWHVSWVMEAWNLRFLKPSTSWGTGTFFTVVDVGRGTVAYVSKFRHGRYLKEVDVLSLVSGENTWLKVVSSTRCLVLFVLYGIGMSQHSTMESCFICDWLSAVSPAPSSKGASHLPRIFLSTPLNTLMPLSQLECFAPVDNASSALTSSFSVVSAAAFPRCHLTERNLPTPQ